MFLSYTKTNITNGGASRRFMRISAIAHLISVNRRKRWGLAKAFQPRHPWAEQPRSGVAETLGSIP
ncbi:hypothetical protein MPL3356_290043 [Mesorhizobium plurifarium]|uniref:Uncharacterized protein n=1 Tax=Mesorhizobium plurifarium TaxID=69974 RepID=A0A090DQM2_MESPL|nr:hypothetical protein MPL3356_290043 [Mesorhizobium plurifarium]CDX56004.1 hypothetical protein MPL1032_20347 [Mesorhizobium plurifarium]